MSIVADVNGIMPSVSDRELLERYTAADDEAAFAELASRHAALVHRVCRRVLRNEHDAEDAAQAAFLVLLRKAPGLRREGSLSAWLHRTARLAALEARRRRQARTDREAQTASWQEDPTPALAEADRTVMLDQLDAAVDSLAAHYREAVVLRYLQGLGEKEAAAQAGCSLGTIKSRTSRGLEKLRARLGKCGVTIGTSAALAGVLASGTSAAVPETLLPSILATVKGAAATTAAATGLASVAMGAKEAATPTAVMLAEGVLRMMFWTRIKKLATLGAAALLALTALGVLVARAQPANPPAPAVAQAPAATPIPKPAPGAPAPTPSVNTDNAYRILGLGGFQAPGTIQPPVRVDPTNRRVGAICLMWQRKADDRLPFPTHLEFVVWDLATGAVQQRLPLARREGNSGSVYTLGFAFIDNGNRAVVMHCRTSVDVKAGRPVLPHPLQVIDLERGTAGGEFDAPTMWAHATGLGVQTWIVSPDTRFVFAAVDGTREKPSAVNGTREKPLAKIETLADSICVWETATGKLVTVLEKPVPPASLALQERDFRWGFRRLGVSSNGRRLCALFRSHGLIKVDGGEAWGEGPAFVVMWDWRKGTVERTWALPKDFRTSIGIADDIVWLADDTQVLVPGDGETVTLEVETGNVCHTFPSGCTASSGGETAYAAIREKDEDVSASWRLQAFDLATGKKLVAPDLGALAYEPSTRADDLALSADGTWLTANLGCGDRGLGLRSFALLDLTSQAALAPAGFTTVPEWLCYNPDGRLLVRQHRGIKVFDGAGGRESWIPGAGTEPGSYPWPPLLSPDGSTLWTERGLADVNSGTLLASLDQVSNAQPPRSPYGLSPSGGQLLAATDVPSKSRGMQRNEKIGLLNAHTGTPLADWRLRPPPWQDACILACQWDAREQRLFLADFAWLYLVNEGVWPKEPLGFTGAFDTRTGKRLYWFRDDQGKPVQAASLLRLCEDRDLIFMAIGHEGQPFRGTFEEGTGGEFRFELTEAAIEPGDNGTDTKMTTGPDAGKGQVWPGGWFAVHGPDLWYKWFPTVDATSGIHKCGLWRASDGAFVRWVDTLAPMKSRGEITALPDDVLKLVRPAVRFVNGNRWLAGPDAVVDVDTGKALRHFTVGKVRELSPSGTWVACLEDDWTLTLCDVRTGVELRRRYQPPPELAAAKPKLLVWHPAETHLAFTLEDRPAVVELELFPTPASPPAAVAEPAALERCLAELALEDLARRAAAVGALADARLRAEPALAAWLAHPDRTPPEAVLGVQVLERRARRGHAAAVEALASLAKGPGDRWATGCAGDARLRLAAADRVAALRRHNLEAAATAP